jgi:hypothetical protein
MKIKDRIDEINKIRHVLDEEVKTLTESCIHDEYHVGTFSWRVGCYDLMRICTECSSTLGAPSDDELNDFNVEYDELNKESIEKRNKDKENNKNNNIIFIDPMRIGQGTKIYKREFSLENQIPLYPQFLTITTNNNEKGVN